MRLEIKTPPRASVEMREVIAKLVGRDLGWVFAGCNHRTMLFDVDDKHLEHIRKYKFRRYKLKRVRNNPLNPAQ